MRPFSVELSPYRDEYERMRFEQNRPIKEIWALSRSRGENIGYYAFQRYFRKVQRELDTVRESSKLRKKVIEEQLKKDIEVSQRITRNLEICDRLIQPLIEKKELSKEDARILFEAMTETRLIIDQLLRWHKELNISPGESDLEKRIMYCIQDFPLDLKKKFLERWSTYDLERPPA